MMERKRTMRPPIYCNHPSECAPDEKNYKKKLMIYSITRHQSPQTETILKNKTKSTNICREQKRNMVLSKNSYRKQKINLVRQKQTNGFENKQENLAQDPDHFQNIKALGEKNTITN